MNLWLFLVVLGSGFFLSNIRNAASHTTERKIVLLPIGQVEGWILDVLEKDLAEKFEYQVERHQPMNVPKDALNPARGLSGP